MKKHLLACGIFSSVWYIGMNVFITFLYEGYSYSYHTVSELSAIGAPTRSIWVLAGLFYTVLFAAFGIGVLKTANGGWRLRLVAIMIIAYSALNVYWPPMHQRGITPSLTDTLHIVWTSITVVLMMVMMGFGAVTFGPKFRYYTIASMVLLLVFGFITSLDAPKIPNNLPTPWLGIWERILIFLFTLWVIVLSFNLIRRVPGEKRVVYFS